MLNASLPFCGLRDNDWLRDTDGMWRTYWMLTHPQTGRYVEAEGGDDAECLQACTEQMNA